ncbi:peptide ABC transporter substrate-binding protein [Paenibacillus alvei]|uniref:Peptide ABC transporter substrate-binding protein n=1 Tax=Paenibacillus alvei TaxID=44250 RepID=A0AAP6ZSS1_PAEAL|nr:peptide ABC transporter substrate-binding protein [Paenibacillus alvei]NOJ69236.1 peptide ABC transporter substrate-binding protein [Paenibacillus alvei]
MKRRSMMLMLTLLLAISAFVSACGSSSTPAPESKPSETQNSGDSGTGEKKEENKDEAFAADQTFRFNLKSEPPSLDPGTSQDTTSFQILSHIYEGLTRMDEHGKAIPGIAEKWEEDAAKKKYTFHLRKDAKWSNGDPVTAKDFEKSWKRVLDPTMQPAPPYAYQLYYIKGAEDYHKKKSTDPNSVAVKALDEYTLEVELASPTAYFLSLLSFQTYFPVHSDDRNSKWASEANTIISNGPFKITDWKHQNSIELVKNENYYAKDEVKLTKVQMTIVEDPATEMSMYETGALEIAGQPTGEIPVDQIAMLKESKPDELKIKSTATTYYYLFNNKLKPFDNVNIRKALAMAIDRKQIVENVTLGGQTPAFGIVGKGIVGLNDEYRNEADDSVFFKEDVAEAKALLEKGLKESGLTELPEFTLAYNTNEMHKKAAVAIANMWKNTLGIKVKVENQEWGVFLKNRTALNYQVARAGWTADYNDPMTFIDLYMIGSGNNDIGYSNPEYDKLVKDAKASTDPKARMELMKQAEKKLIAEDMAIMPIFYQTSVQLQKPYVKNVFIDYQGQMNFTRGYLAEH